MQKERRMGMVNDNFMFKCSYHTEVKPVHVELYRAWGREWSTHMNRTRGSNLFF